MTSSATLFLLSSWVTELSFTITLEYVVVFRPMNPGLSFPAGDTSATNLSFDKNQEESLFILYSCIRLRLSRKFTLASLPSRMVIFWMANVLLCTQQSPSKVL